LKRTLLVAAIALILASPGATLAATVLYRPSRGEVRQHGSAQAAQEAYYRNHYYNGATMYRNMVERQVQAAGRQARWDYTDLTRLKYERDVAARRAAMARDPRVAFTTLAPVLHTNETLRTAFQHVAEGAARRQIRTHGLGGAPFGRRRP